MMVPTICPACWQQDGEPATVDGGCVHYWHHRCDDVTIALDDLAGEVNETGIPSAEQPDLFDSWMRATVVLQQGAKATS